MLLVSHQAGSDLQHHAQFLLAQLQHLELMEAEQMGRGLAQEGRAGPGTQLLGWVQELRGGTTCISMGDTSKEESNL